MGYLDSIQANNGIQNFEAGDVGVEPGQAADAVEVKIAIQPTMSAAKIYLTIQLN